MIVELEIGGTSRRVERRGAQLFLDRHGVDIDSTRIGSHTWSILRGRRSYEISLVERAPGELTVHVNGRVVRVRIGLERFASRRARTAGTVERIGHHRVVAPMPGRIARVLVKVGDTVKARQGLIVVEAMKMENELRALCAGTVTEVRAVQGALVDAHTVLIVLE